MPLGYFFRKFKDFFKIFKRETYVGLLPPSMTMEQVQRLVNKAYLEENKNLKAQNVRLRATLEERKKADIGKRREEKIETEIIRFNERKKLEKYKNTIGLRIYTFRDGKWKPLEKLPTFFLKSDRPFHKFAGFFLEQTEEGYRQCFPWLQYRKKDTAFKKGAPNFESFFQRNIGIVSQIMGGKVDSNFDIGRGKKPLFKPSGEYTTNPDEKVKVINLSEQERKELEDTIATQREQISQLVNTLERSHRIIDKYDKDSLERSISSSTSEEKAETYASSLMTLGQEIPALARSVSDVLGLASTATIKQKVGEANAYAYLSALRAKEKIFRDTLSKEPEEVMKIKIKKDLKDVVELQSKLTKGQATKDDIEKIIKILRGGVVATGKTKAG